MGYCVLCPGGGCRTVCTYVVSRLFAEGVKAAYTLSGGPRSPGCRLQDSDSPGLFLSDCEMGTHYDLEEPPCACRFWLGLAFAVPLCGCSISSWSHLGDCPQARRSHLEATGNGPSAQSPSDAGILRAAVARSKCRRKDTPCLLVPTVGQQHHLFHKDVPDSLAPVVSYNLGIQQGTRPAAVSLPSGVPDCQHSSLGGKREEELGALEGRSLSWRGREVAVRTKGTSYKGSGVGVAYVLGGKPGSEMTGQGEHGATHT